MKTIVISAVNIVEAGPLTILKDCLSALSEWAADRKEEYRVIAIVYKKELVNFPKIEYIETQWPKKRWINRLWYEYVSLKRISKTIGPVYLWFSLHDTTPNVIAERQAVYCHNALSFYTWKFQDFVFAPKMTLLAILTKYIYRPNIHRNRYLVVQQEWFRRAMIKMFDIPHSKIIVAPPRRSATTVVSQSKRTATGKATSFIYAASPNNHKNFEVICKAVDILNNRHDVNDFKVYVTLLGNENKYAKWLYKNWGGLESIEFIGFLSKEKLQEYYEKCNCLIFPSKVESWGLPISEFAAYDKYMLVADLPYARETAEGSRHTVFFDPDKPEVLATLMMQLIKGEEQAFKPVPVTVMAEPIADDWSDLFYKLLDTENV